MLTCHPRAYDVVKADLEREIPPGTTVERAFALDTARHLSIAGWYPGFLARPDRWISWWPAAVLRGRRLVREYEPAAIFSTYPIATAHMIGHSLARASGLPWVADFRDPMAQDGYPEDPRSWASFKRVEERVFGKAALCTFTTPGAARSYRNRYPGSNARVEVIENGFDEDSFAAEAALQRPLSAGVLTLLHSGIVYPAERDPAHLMAALAMLKERGNDGRRLRIRFRAAVHDRLLLDLARAHGVEDMLEVVPHLPYRQALVEMLRADALLLLQAANCNEQIPAKLYEYLRARRPILALTDPAGTPLPYCATAGSMRLRRSIRRPTSPLS